MALRWRRVSAVYLAIFFLAVAAAPHHHLDPIADLVTDGPSNSGSFTRIVGPVDLEPGLYTGSLIDDESCLACFNKDFVASPAIVVAFTEPLTRLPLHPLPPSLAKPELVPAETSSRGPPTLS